MTTKHCRPEALQTIRGFWDGHTKMVMPESIPGVPAIAAEYLTWCQDCGALTFYYGGRRAPVTVEPRT